MSDRLIDRWVSGMASAEDRAELCELIENDPTLADRLFRAAERECDLAEFFRGLPTISATAPTPPRPTRLRRVSSNIRWLPIASGMAAALLVALFAITAMHFTGSHTSEPTPITVNKPMPTVPSVAKNPTSAPVETLPVPLAVDERTTLAQVFDEPVIEPVEAASTKPRPTTSTTTTSTNKPTPPVMLAANTKPKDRTQHIDRVDGELKDAEGGFKQLWTQMPWGDK